MIRSYLVTGSTARLLILHKELLPKFFAAVLAPGIVDWLKDYSKSIWIFAKYCP
jgi:hypothetical protein